MGLLDKMMRKRYNQKLEKKIKQARELMERKKYGEAHRLLEECLDAMEKDVMIDFEGDPRFDEAIKLRADCEVEQACTGMRPPKPAAAPAPKAEPKPAPKPEPQKKPMTAFEAARRGQESLNAKAEAEKAPASAPKPESAKTGADAETRRRAQEAYKRGEAFYRAEDYFAAADSYRAAAELGHAGAQLMLATMYGSSDSSYIPTDLNEAEKWAQRAAENGHELAPSWLENIREQKKTYEPNPEIYCMRGMGCAAEEDYASAFKWFRAAVDLGDTTSLLLLGALYGEGLGVEQDLSKAEKLARQALDAGVEGAAELLSQIRKARGEDTAPATKPEKTTDAERAYDAGIAACERNDFVSAAKYFRKAAEQGLAEAQFNLGLMYDNGEGVAQNRVEAAKWYRKAAEQGNAGAQNNLAGMYCYGVGVPQDLDEAERWAKRAADNGDENAPKLLEVIRKLR